MPHKPEIREKRRLQQREYYKIKSQDPEWRKRVGVLVKKNREKKLVEQPGFRERERTVARAWENTIPGKAVHLLKGARHRSPIVTISKEWIIGKLEKGICEATGVPFKKENGKSGPYTATLDRIEQNKGYTEENTRMVIWAFNKAKGEWGEDVLVHWIKGYMTLCPIQFQH